MRLPCRHLLTIVFLLLPWCSNAQIPAFPGAEGFGAWAKGGRGGDVYYVTNLSSSGSGSFAYGIQTAPAGGRTILFATSGHIRMPSGSGVALSISGSNITVAGQTAPGGGICFYNNTMGINGSDLIFRNIRWRIGKVTAATDSIDFDGATNVIFDHCDMMFGTDENMSTFSSPATKLTYQWSTNAWGLLGHSCGGLWPVQLATVHHTLWACNHTRNPKLIGPDVFDWVNNVTFSWDYSMNMAQNGVDLATHRVNVRSSYFVHGGSNGEAIYGGGLNSDGSTKFKLYMNDSALDGNNNGILDVSKTNYGMVTAADYTQSTTPWAQTVNGSGTSAIIGVPVTTDPRLTAYKKVVSQVGATRMDINSANSLRDEFSQEAVNRLVTMQRSIIADPLDLGLPCGSMATLKATAAPVDTDKDGMPDYWEDALGFNKNVANNNTLFTAPEIAASFFPAGSPVGYTQLEEYLHFLAVPHGVVSKNTVASPSFIDIDLTKFTSGFTASPVFTVSNVTGGTTSASGPGNAIVRFTPTVNTSGHGVFYFTVTDSAGSTWTQQCCLLISTQLQPRPIKWVGDGTNTWNTTSNNWLSLTGSTAFIAGDAVTFDSTGSTTTINLSGTLQPNSVTVNTTTKNYTFQGTGLISGSATLAKTGTGTLTISNTGPNNFSAVSVDEGTLSVTASGGLGSAPISLSNAAFNFSVDVPGALTLDGTVALNPSGARTLNGSWTGAATVNVNNTGSSLFSFGGSMTAFEGTVNLGSSTGSARLYGSYGSATATFDLGTSSFTLVTRNGGNTFHLGALTGGSNTTLSGATSTSSTTIYSIGALGESTVFSGKITNGTPGLTAITKTGTGTLTLAGSCSYTGTTSVSSGQLVIDGSLGATPVVASADATLAGDGVIGGTVTAGTSAIISPGNTPGGAATLTVGGLTLNSATLAFDLSSDPASGNDKIVVSGTAPTVTLTGVQNFAFNLTQTTLGSGTYDLITTTGTLTTTGSNFTSNLQSGARQTAIFEISPSGTAPGFVRLNVSGSAGNLVWTGSNGGLWDLKTTTAWSGASPATFFNADTVTFNDTASSGTATITTPVAPQTITVNNGTRAYTFTGAPITGPGSLVKSGTGTLTLNVPQYTGTSCGLTTGSPTVTAPSTAGFFPGMTVIGTGIPADTTILSVVNATTVILSQNATVTSASTSLIFETRNTFSGGTIINAGSLTLACNTWQYYSSSTPPPSNAFGLGTGPITLNGGTLTLFGHADNANHLYGALPNDLIVPGGKTATLRSTMRGTSYNDIAGLRGNLTGSGTLNLVVNFTYGAIVGDWSAFSGTLNVSRPTSGANDPRFQLGNDLGLPLATVSLDQVQLEYAAVPPADGVVVPIGSLTGTSTAVISGAQNAATSVTWSVGGLNKSGTFAGSFTPYSGGGPIGLEKTGTGTWTLTGTGTVSAGITVEQGTLAVSGSIGGTGDNTIASGAVLQMNGGRVTGNSLELFSGATLRGRGAINGAVTNSGTLAMSSGTLTINGDAYLAGTLLFENIATDRLAVTGSTSGVSLSGLIVLSQTSGLPFGRTVLMTYAGPLNRGSLGLGALPSGYIGTLDTGTPGQVAVVLNDRVAYNTWMTTYYDPASANGQPDTDSDGDGMTNIEEYQAGTLPNDPNSSVALVWQGGGTNPWDLGATATWIDSGYSRVFRNNRNVNINDTGSNSPAIQLIGTLQPGSVIVSNTTKAFTFDGTGSLSGTTGLTKNGTGTLTILTSNSYTGDTIVNAGVVNIQDNNALGTAAKGTTVANNARLELEGGITVSGEALSIAGQGGSSFYNGALNSKSGTNTWAGNVVVSATGTRIGAQSNATLIVSGSITSGTSNFGLTVRPNDMTATVVLSGSNNYVGDTAVIGGVLKLDGGENRLPVGTALKLGSSSVSGVVDLNGWNQQVASISVVGSGTANEIKNSAVSSSTLTVSNTTAATFSGKLSGNLWLVKSGTATLTLSGTANNYTGSTTVTSGTLSIASAFLSNTSTVTIHTGAKMTLAFTGTDTVGTLALGVTTMGAGVMNATTHPAFFTGTGNLRIDGATPLADYMGGFYPGQSDPAIVGPSADPDKDGILNLMEFALNLSPKTPSVIPAVLVKNGSWLEYTYTRNPSAADAVTYIVEWSDTLAAGSWSNGGVTEQSLGGNTVKATIPAGSGPKRFVRLRVIQP